MKWLNRIAVGVVGVLLIAVVVVYGWSATLIGKEYTAKPRAFTYASTPEMIEQGERLAQVLGCYRGCHGADMEGSTMVDKPLVGRLVAPNLTRAIETYTTAELEAIIRQGILPDGHGVKAMPSDGFSIMTTDDLAAILSFISNYPKQENDEGKTRVGPIGRIALISGVFTIPAEGARPSPWPEGFRDNPLQLGEYLATLACAECHGPDLQGRKDFTPPLTIVKAYSLPDFQILMSTGLGLGNRNLGLMTQVSEYRFKHMTDAEVAALHTYLQSL